MADVLAVEGRIPEPSFERQSSSPIRWTRSFSAIPSGPKDWSDLVFSYVSAARSTDTHIRIISSFDQGEAFTYVFEPKLTVVEPDPEHRIAAFTLDRDTDNELVFSDGAGVAYGVGQTFKDAVDDWYIAATEIAGELRSSQALHPRLTGSLQFLDNVLGQGG